MKKLFMPIITTIFLTPISTHAACTATPDCATLGYIKTSADCPDGGVKCPFDTTKMYCPEVKDECEVGSILYSDMSCSYSKISGKTAIGVVSYVNGRNHVAISLVEPTEKAWSNDYTDIPGVTNYTNETSAKSDFSGKANTTAWVAYYGDTSTTYAQGYCHNYTTEGTKKGDWYLPALGELYASFVTNQTQVKAGLSIAKGTAINNTSYACSVYYTSSTESDSRQVWELCPWGRGSVDRNSTKTTRNWTRCVISF